MRSCNHDNYGELAEPGESCPLGCGAVFTRSDGFYFWDKPRCEHPDFDGVPGEACPDCGAEAIRDVIGTRVQKSA